MFKYRVLDMRSSYFDTAEYAARGLLTGKVPRCVIQVNTYMVPFLGMAGVMFYEIPNHKEILVYLLWYVIRNIRKVFTLV